MNQKKKISDRIFVLILNKHRLWGSLLLPYIIEKTEGKDYYSPVECLSPYASIDTMENLTEAEIEIIELINSYSNRYLFRLFSREKTVVEFTEKINEDRFEKHIKPYIERKLVQCFNHIRQHSLVVYRQKAGSGNLHREDILNINSDNAEAVFTFEKGSEQSYYQLDILINKKKIKLISSDIEIISKSPCLIRHNDEILFINDIEGSKLKPFLTKEKIIIPPQHTEKYFSGFVLNIVNNHRVIPKGFEIIEIFPDKKPVLYLELGIKNIPVLILKFNYNVKEIFNTSSLRSFTIFESNNTYIFKKILRDLIWEEECIKKLNDLGFYSEDNINFTATGRTGSKKEELYSLIESVNDLYIDIIEAGFDIKRGSLDKQYNLEPVQVNINYNLDNDWFDLHAIVKIGNKEIPFINLRKHILGGNREYILDDGSVAILPEEWFTRYRELFELGNIQDDSLKIHKQHFSLLNEIFDKNECKTCHALEKLIIPDEMPDIDVPKGLQTEIRHYQKEGFKWLVFLQKNKLGGCLADDMGLGKTIQTLALLQYNKEHSSQIEVNDDDQHSIFPATVSTQTTLLVVPSSLLYNWQSEINKFTPSLKTYCYKGMQRNKSSHYFRNYDIILSSYHTVRQDIEIMSGFSFYYIILDESQVIKNPASQLYKTISRLKSDHKLVLTGTPVENSLTDLWSQLNFVNSGLLGSLSYFKREFARPIEKEQSIERERKLQKIIKPFILRRTKEQVAGDLPPVMENMVYCDMSDEQQKKYEEEKSAVRNNILENIEKTGREKSAIIVLQGLMKLRQISNHPRLAYPDYDSNSGKFDIVLQDIESVVSEGHKILVFSSFVRHLNLFAEKFDSQNLKYAMLTGSSNNRGEIVNSFQDDIKIKVFLISLKAGGLGLNLTSADYVFILDPWWNPAAEMQALSRSHRIGQDKPVFVHRYISSKSIEEKIVKLQKRKSELAEAFISTNNPLKDLNIEDILDLIG